MPVEQKGPAGFQLKDPPEATGAEATSREPGGPLAFGTLILSLATSGLVHLGRAPQPETGAKGPTDLALARQTIDILEMLEQKTRGNLDAEEQRLLGSVLHDLRMAYLEVRGEQSSH
jgi:hypothetical protein